WDKLPEGDKLQAKLIRKLQKEFAKRSLKSPRQLPTIKGADIILVWDIEDYNKGGDTLIEYGDQIIWREPAIFEGYERFREVAAILKRKYRDRLQDLVPTQTPRSSSRRPKPKKKKEMTKMLSNSAFFKHARFHGA